MQTFHSKQTRESGAVAWFVVMMVSSVVLVTIAHRYLNAKNKFSTVRTVAQKENTDNYLNYAINQTSNLIAVGAVAVLPRNNETPFLQDNEPDNSTYYTEYNSTAGYYEMVFDIANPKYIEFEGAGGEVQTNGEPQTFEVRVQIQELVIEQTEEAENGADVIKNSIKVKAYVEYPISRIQYSYIRPSIVRYDKTSQGYDHTCAVASDGAAYCWGRNDYGQLGVGRTDEDQIGVVKAYPFPQKVSGNYFFIDIYAGKQFTCGKVKVEDPIPTNNSVTKLGRLYCWGRNHRGQLGDGTTDDRLEPTAVARGDFSNVNKIDTFGVGYTHACATQYGEKKTFCWGEERYTATDTSYDGGNQLTPKEVYGTPSNRWSQFVYVGSEHSCVVLSTGSNKVVGFGYDYIYCWGKNDVGQLGNNKNASNYAGGAANAYEYQAVYVNQPSGSYTYPVMAWAAPSLPAVMMMKNATCANYMVNSGGWKRRIYCWGDYAPGGTAASKTPEWIKSSINYGRDVYIIDASAHASGGKIWVVEAGEGATVGSTNSGNFLYYYYANDWPNSGGERRLVSFDNYIGDNTRTVHTLPDGALRKMHPLGFGVIRSSSDPATIGHVCVTLINLRAYCWGDNSYGQLGQGERVSMNAAVNQNDFPDYTATPMDVKVVQPFEMWWPDIN